MRTPLIFLAGIIITTAACRRAEPDRFTLQRGSVERVEGCHIIMDHATDHEDAPFAGVRYVCGVSESALKEKPWWGDKPEPLAFSMHVGDCLLLGTSYYCVEEIEPGTKASFKATYKKMHRTGDLLERIR